MTEHRLAAYRAYAESLAGAGATIMKELLGEIDRLKAGRFTEEEFQNLCHNFKPDDLRRFRQGCEDYQAKLFGLKKPSDENERQKLREYYDGETEPCCECGEDYPKADLIIDGEVFCPACREKERATSPRG